MAAAGSATGGSRAILSMPGKIRLVTSNVILLEVDVNLSANFNEKIQAEFDDFMKGISLEIVEVSPQDLPTTGINAKDRHVYAGFKKSASRVLVTLDRDLQNEVNLLTKQKTALIPGGILDKLAKGHLTD